MPKLVIRSQEKRTKEEGRKQIPNSEENGNRSMCCAVLSALRCSVVSDSLQPQGLWPGSPVHGDSPGKNTGVGCHAFLQGILNPGIEPRSPTFQVDSLPSEPPQKPRNTEVGSLSLLQGIFPTQERNQGLLHCRWILLSAELPGKPQ